MTTHPLIVIALCAALSACGSTPQSNYYLLSAHTGQFPAAESPTIGVGPIEMPEYLNRNSLVYNRQGNQLHISGYERWAEPLSAGMSRVISLNLAGLLGTESVQTYPWHQTVKPDYGVRVTLLELDAGPDGAKLVAEWQLYKPKDESRLVQKISQFEQELPEGELRPEHIAPAYSKLLLQLSELIAREIEVDLAGT